MQHVAVDVVMLPESQMKITQRIPLETFITNVPYVDKNGRQKKAYYGIAAMKARNREMIIKEIGRDEQDGTFLVFLLQKQILLVGFYWPPAFSIERCRQSFQRAEMFF